MNYLIDAGVLITMAGAYGRAGALYGAKEGRWAVSVVSLDELLRSGMRGLNGPTRAQRTAVVGVVAERFEILPIDEMVIRVHATLRDGLKKSRHSLGFSEGWIAATCLAHGFTLVTDRATVFRSVGQLAINPWMSNKRS